MNTHRLSPLLFLLLLLFVLWPIQYAYCDDWKLPDGRVYRDVVIVDHNDKAVIITCSNQIGDVILKTSELTPTLRQLVASHHSTSELNPSGPGSL
jgi:hypothetical protein